MDKVSLKRLAICIVKKGNCTCFFAIFGNIAGNHGFPIGAAEQIIAKGEGVAEVVLFHDPWRAQAAAVDAILNRELREKNFFQNF